MRAWIPDRALWGTGTTVVLTLMPWAALVAIAWHYTVDVPYWDDWELVPILDRALQGTLSFTDAWAQHNEHRPLFPRLLMVCLALPAGWTVWAGVTANVALISVLVPVLWWTLREGTRQRDVPLAVLTWPTVALLVFSPSQWQNWLWGWQIGLLLHVASDIVGLALLCRRHVGWGTWTLAALLGIVGSYSFASGLLYWPPQCMSQPLGATFADRGRHYRVF